MPRRSRAREVVLQLLYEADLNPGTDAERIDAFTASRLSQDKDLAEFATSLFNGVRQNHVELDNLLTERAANWALARMAATDRNILRLGAYEILYTDTPNRSVINEAVELAKRFGAKKSPQFVNGILDQFLPDEVEKG